MSANHLNRYIYRRGSSFGMNIVSDEPLGANGMLNSGQMLRIIYKGQYEPTIEELIDGFSKDITQTAKKVEEAIEGDWYYYGIERDVKPNALVKYVVAPTTGNVGENHSVFTLCIDNPIFIDGDIVKFNSERQARVLSDAVSISSGGGYNYQFRLIDADFLPPSDYNGIDSRVIKLTTAYPKGSYGNPFHWMSGMSKYRTPLQIFRKAFEIEGSALTREKIMLCYDKQTGKSVWWREELGRSMKEFEQEISNAMLFQKTSIRPDGTTTLFDAKGKPIYTFDGIYETVRKANYYQVPTFTLEALQDLISTILIITKESGAYNHEFLVLCGYQALRKVQKALGSELHLLPMVFDQNLFLRKGDYKGRYGVTPKNNISIGWTFTQYEFLGSKINFVHCPYLDSTTLNPKVDPDTGFASKSNEMIILNMSDYKEGMPNVVNLYRAGNGISRKMIVKYINGMHSLNGSGGDVASTSFDGAQCEMLAHRGIVVHYPYTCGILSVQDF